MKIHKKFIRSVVTYRLCVYAVTLLHIVDRYAVTANEILYGVACCQLPSVKTVSTLAQPSFPYIIAIDPGHGGYDTGAESIVVELDVCELTADYLYRFLASDENFLPMFTREKGEDPDSTERAETADKAGACLLISIHANSDSSKSSHGFECYPVPPGRKNYEQSMKFAEYIANAMRNAGHYLRGGEEKTGIKFAYYNGSNKRIVDSSDTKIRSQKSFGILEKASCPAVLVEQCFVTNYSDVENWASDSGCKKSAEVYYRAIKDYFGVS